MSENVMAMASRGYFAGEFVVTNDDCAYSIGDHIEVVLKDHAYPTGETFDVPRLGGGEKIVHIAAFPLTVTLSAHVGPIEVLLKMAVGRAFSHWLDCLEIGVPSVVIPNKCEHRKHIWYMPKIDGWVPSGMFSGKTKAATTTNRRTKNA
jgi:hypothetical protein